MSAFSPGSFVAQQSRTPSHPRTHAAQHEQRSEHCLAAGGASSPPLFKVDLEVEGDGCALSPAPPSLIVPADTDGSWKGHGVGVKLAPLFNLGLDI